MGGRKIKDYSQQGAGVREKELNKEKWAKGERKTEKMI